MSCLSYLTNKIGNNNNKLTEHNSCILQLEESTKCMEIFELFLSACNYGLRIIDDVQFHKYNIPFPSSIWIKFIETFKYICYISYWRHYSHLNKFKLYFERNRRHNTNKLPLSIISLLEIYYDKFESFVLSVTSVFSSLRDRNTRKSFIQKNDDDNNNNNDDDDIWLMDKYIDLQQFEKEILNLSDSDIKHNDDNDVQMQQNNNNNNAFPVDAFNPFSNHEFGYNEMYGGSNMNNITNESQQNLRRFEDNFNMINDDEMNNGVSLNTNNNMIKTEQDNKFRRSFLILIEIPFVIPFKLRVKLFYALIEFEKDELESSGHSIRINRGNAIKVKIRRDNILDDGYRGLNKYKFELKTLIQIEFENKYGEIEAGIDGGGIFKEFLNELIRDAFDPQSEYLNELYPNPNYFKISELMNINKDYFEFLGKMVGKALYDSILIEPIFSQFFLRKLLLQYNYIDDLQSFDIDLYKQLMSLKHDYSNKNQIENMELTFSINEDILGTKRTFNLIPNGFNIFVNHSNRHKYINILADFKLNKSMYQQSLSFLRGMSNIINLDYLRIFDAKELSKLLSGDTNTTTNWINSWKDLRANTIYSGGFHDNHRLIKWFWEILNNELTIDDNSKFLQFVTSCTRAPLLGFKSLNPKFNIMCTGGDTVNLPTSQTCMNLLKLPNYKNKQMLKDKLLQSIRSNDQ